MILSAICESAGRPCTEPVEIERWLSNPGGSVFKASSLRKCFCKNFLHLVGTINIR
jgi:hypothetical protein